MRLVAIAGLCISLLGCSSAETGDLKEELIEVDHMQCLTNLYCLYQIQNRGNGPENRSDFKRFIAQQPKRSLRRIGVEPAKIDDLFVSERDNESFRIKYGIVGNASETDRAIIFEASGSDGERRVAFSSRKEIVIKDADKYDELWNKKS